MNDIRTSAAAHACWCSAGSGCSEYVKMSTGMLGSACVTSVLTLGAKIEHVKSSGAVSPAARAIAITVPVRMPPSAVGMITPTTVRQRETPSARLASRSVFGTSSNTSCVARVTSGSITIARATAPAYALCRWPTTSSP